MRGYNQGWKSESERHSLARRGVKTGKKLKCLGLVLVGGAGYVGYKMGKKKHLHAKGVAKFVHDGKKYSVFGEAYNVRERYEESGVPVDNVPENWYEYEMFLMDEDGQVVDSWDSLAETYNGVQRLSRSEAERWAAKNATKKDALEFFSHSLKAKGRKTLAKRPVFIKEPFGLPRELQPTGKFRRKWKSVHDAPVKEIEEDFKRAYGRKPTSDEMNDIVLEGEW